MAIAQTERLESPITTKILTYNEWRESAGSKDTYGHYAEYVFQKTLNNIGIRAEKTAEREDAPGGGDVAVYKSNGERILLDIKTVKDGYPIDYQITGRSTADFQISGLDVERLRSGNRDTQEALIIKLSDVAKELS
jgi:hypothetical protein